MDMTRSDGFVIVGGGIGGLATALALSRDDHQVRVLERATEFGEVGAGLQLAPNATRVLRRWGLLDELTEFGLTPRRLVLADALGGGELASLDLGALFVERYGAPYVVAHRSDLLDLLLRACRRTGVSLETGRDVIEMIPDPDGVTVRCADGSEWRGEVAVGADGLRSRVRTLLHEEEPVCSGYVAYRGAIPTERARHRADPRDVVAWIGPGLHLVQYLIHGGELHNQVAVFRSPGYQAGAPDWGTPEELRDAFAGTCPHVRGSIESLWLDQHWPMYDREPIDTWVSDGRVVLVGDAAHPMLQYLAQGACQALEDAEALAASARRHLSTSREPAAVLRALTDYQQARAPRTARVQRNARTWGDIWHLDGLAARLRDDAFAHRSATDYSATDWLYGATEHLRESSPGTARAEPHEGR